MVSAAAREVGKISTIRLRKVSRKDFCVAAEIAESTTSNDNYNDGKLNTATIDNDMMSPPSSPRERNRYPVALIDSFCLVFSSLFFLIPGYLAHVKGLHWYLITSVATTTVSVNYWRHAVPGFRRDLDMIFAKISFTIYFITGFINIKDPGVLTLAWPICFAIVGFYALSSICWEKDSSFWVYFHMLFHLFVAVEQYLVLFASF